MAIKTDSATGQERGARRRARWIVLVAAVPVLLVGGSYFVTPPLEPVATDATPLAEPEADRVEAAEAKIESLTWPVSSLDGEPAKQLLLDALLAARERLNAVEGYTATLKRRERLNGKLGDPQTLEMKVRHRPFAVYLKFVEPEAGKEVVYAQGRYDDHVMAHPGGMTRAFLPRLKVPPHSALAMAGNRHPITDAGLLNLTERLIGFREMDLKDPEAETVLDRVVDDHGRPRLRSIHTHPTHHPERPFAYVEVLYDPETMIPVKITSFDWPESPADEDLKLAEQYEYEDLKLDAPLTDLDFDPANPAYEFRRF